MSSPRRPGLLPSVEVPGICVQFVLLDPGRMDAGDWWWHRCPECGLPTQGGAQGAMSHWCALHPELEIPELVPEAIHPPEAFGGVVREPSAGRQLRLW
jgi:hypothetical protein